MWKTHNNTRGYETAALWDRFQFIFALSTFMRSDSIYEADHYDMCNFTF